MAGNPLHRIDIDFVTFACTDGSLGLLGTKRSSQGIAGFDALSNRNGNGFRIFQPFNLTSKDVERGRSEPCSICTFIIDTN